MTLRSSFLSCPEGKIAKSEGEDTRRLSDVGIFFLVIVSLVSLNVSLSLNLNLFFSFASSLNERSPRILDPSAREPLFRASSFRTRSAL